MSHAEQVLWYVVATRCEKDINGIATVFDQLLGEGELLFLIDALAKLQEPELARAFQQAHEALGRAGFYKRSGAMCHEFGAQLSRELSAVDFALDSEGRMWELDEKLARLADT
jgi:hypothetical protein